MNKKMLALYGLKWNPFAPDVPVEALQLTPRIDSFCWRVEQLAGEGGFALVTGYEKEPVMERKRHMFLIRLTSMPRDLLIIARGFHIESSHVRSSGSLFHRGGFPGLAVASTCSRALRFVSRLARA